MMWLYVPPPESMDEPDENTITILDGCAGSGMLGFACEEALRSLGYPASTLVHIEREAQAAAALVGIGKASGREAPVWDDLATFAGTAWRGLIDLAVACRVLLDRWMRN